MSVYAITTQTYSTPQTFTIGEHTATVDADKIITSADSISSLLIEGDSVYIVNMANSISNILTTLSNLYIYVYIDNCENSIEITGDNYKFNFIQLYINEGITTFKSEFYNITKFISPTIISLDIKYSSSRPAILGSDLPKLESLNSHIDFRKIEIINSQDLKNISVYSVLYLDLHGCPNVKFTSDTSLHNLEYINLNGCLNIDIQNEIQCNNLTFIDLTNINSVQKLYGKEIDFTNKNFSGALLAKTINSISFYHCIAGNLDLKSVNCKNILIKNGTYDNIYTLDNLEYLSINNIPNIISIKTTKSIDVVLCNVSCEKIERDGESGSVVSYYNKGIIGDIIISNSDEFILSVFDCNSIKLTNCTNINMIDNISETFTRSTNSISFINCTFKVFAIDYSSGSVELSNCSWIESDDNQRTFMIKNYNGTINDFSYFPLSKCEHVTLFNCPNFIFDDSTPNSVILINSNTTKNPNSRLLYITNCDLTNWSGKNEILRINSCNNLKSLDLSNVNYCYVYNNINLKSFIVNGISYGIDKPVDEYISQHLSTHFFRFNGFENVNYISNPNFVNGKLKYDDKYIIQLNQSNDIFNNFMTVIENGIISINFELEKNDFDDLLESYVYGLYTITNNHSIISDRYTSGNSFSSNLVDEDIDKIVRNISFINLTNPITVTSGKETISKLEERLLNSPYKSNIILVSTSDNNSNTTSNLFSVKLVM